MSSVTSTNRPLPLRMRADLVVAPLIYDQRRLWGVKDPLSLGYWQLANEEYFVLRQLDGHISLDDLQRRFVREFAPNRIGADQLQAFIGSLYRDGLVVSESVGQGDELLERARRSRWKARLAVISNVLAWRFRGIDPEPWLRRVAPRIGWLFSPVSRLTYLGLVISAVLLVMFQWNTVVARFPELSSFFDYRNAFLLLVAAAFAKVLHELGHAIFCKHYGGECHEIGFMLLVGAPCLYCNVSDAWMLKNKWHRAAIGAAGMIVEVGLAAVALWLWWFSTPGLFNALCFDLMLVCSVNTLLMNGNPLLQYDGYYILADLSETPNLRQQALGVVRQWSAWFLLGVRATQDRLLPDRGRGWMAVYAVASTLYRWAMILALLWVVNQAMKPYDLELLTWLLGWMFVVTLVGVPMFRLFSFLRHPTRSMQVRWNRVAGRGGIIVLGLAALAMIPLPFRPTAPAVVELRNERPVYINTEGRLIDAVEPGIQVEQNAVLARLENDTIERDVRRLTGERDLRRLRLANLNSRRSEIEAASEIPAAEKSLQDASERLRQRRRDQDALTIRSPAPGTVVPPPSRISESAAGEPEDWSGHPLDQRNRGCWLATGVQLCSIGDRNRLDAVLLIDQGDLPFVSVGQSVRLMLDQSPQLELSGKIVELAEIDTVVAPPELLAHQDLPVEQSQGGVARPRGTLYQARVELESLQQPRLNGSTVLVGSSGRAKIYAAPQSLGSRLVRFLNRTFKFEL